MEVKKKDKYPKRYRIVAYLCGPEDSTVEDANRILRFTMPALEIEQVELVDKKVLTDN